MTISTIGNVSADLARIQERQNREDTARASDSASATRTEDVVDVRPDVDAARNLSAEENLRAAESTLNEADFDAVPSAQERVQAQAYEALTAQTNRLPHNILALLNE